MPTPTQPPASAIPPLPDRRQPPWIMRRVVDPLTVWAVGRLGLDDHNGTRVIEVRGRTSGAWRATPVKLLELDGQRYLVAMYGQTYWARNLKASGAGRIRQGRHVIEFSAVELDDAAKLPVLRAYFKRWWALVARMTSVSSPEAPDEEIAAAAHLHPVFRLEPPGPKASV
jgi:deazaflavin-dependent oxidoreductase (nitroreductase family)